MNRVFTSTWEKSLLPCYKGKDKIVCFCINFIISKRIAKNEINKILTSDGISADSVLHGGIPGMKISSQTRYSCYFKFTLMTLCASHIFSLFFF